VYGDGGEQPSKFGSFGNDNELLEDGQPLLEDFPFLEKEE